MSWPSAAKSSEVTGSECAMMIRSHDPDRTSHRRMHSSTEHEASRFCCGKNLALNTKPRCPKGEEGRKNEERQSEVRQSKGRQSEGRHGSESC